MNDDMPTVEGALAELGKGLGETQSAPQTQAQGGALESLGGAVMGAGNPAFAATGVESLNPAPTPMTTGLPVTTPQMQGLDSVMDAAKAGGMTWKARNPSGAYNALMQSLRPATAPVPPAADSSSAPAQPAAPAAPAAPEAPAMPQFTKVRSAFGGPDTYGYDYNGTQVAFPSGFNTKDQKAVKKYMDETNAIIDWINRDNEED